MKLNQDLYAVVRPDGSVAGNGDGLCLHQSLRWATDDATDPFVERRNGGVPLRVARVRLVEGIEWEPCTAEQYAEAKDGDRVFWGPDVDLPGWRTGPLPRTMEDAMADQGSSLKLVMMRRVEANPEQHRAPNQSIEPSLRCLQRAAGG